MVLVADDREEDRFMLQRAFQQLGFSTPVHYVTNGDDAITYLAGNGRFANRDKFPVPNLLLLDLKMPGKSGFDVLSWIQQQPNLTNLRTVVLTTSEDIYEVNRAYKLGAASFLTKPLSFTEFKDTIQAVYNYWMMINRLPAFQSLRNGSIVSPQPSTLDASIQRAVA